MPGRSGAKTGKRTPPINIPLDFESAVDGLLQVDPKEPEESARKPPAKKKPAKRKKPRRAKK